MLAGRGFDADKVAQTLNSIQVTQAFEPMQPLEDTDVEGYLKNEHELMIVSAMEESRRETMSSFQTHFEARLRSDWEVSKKRIFESIGHLRMLNDGATSSREIKTGAMTSAGGLVTAKWSATAPLTAVPEVRLQKYAKAVEELNNLRLQNRPIQVVALFEAAVGAADGVCLSLSIIFQYIHVDLSLRPLAAGNFCDF